MMIEEEDDLTDVISRWEVTGLLDGLPQWEKEELAVIYDNVTRVILSKSSTTDPNKFEVLGDVVIPVVRRLYRRVGVNFDPYRMVEELSKSVHDNYNILSGPVTKDKNPIVSFCVDFADGYEDEQITSRTLPKDQYDKSIDKLGEVITSILKSNEMVSHINKINDEWEIKYTNVNKSPNQIRIWNQKRGLEILNIELKNLNQGS